MADRRVIVTTHISDPTTPAQRLAVDSSGRITVLLGPGTQNIGDVDVLTLPADPLGANADAIVAAGAAGSLSAKLRRTTQGIEDLKSLIVLAAGNNNIGDVDVASVPADPFGANADAIVAAGAAGSYAGKFRRMTQGLEDLKTTIVLAAGNNNIGDVDIASGPTGASSLQHQGAGAAGAAVVGNPVLVGGTDGTNARSILVSAAGRLSVDINSGGGSDTPTSPTLDNATSSGTAAGSSANLDSADLGGSTRKLAQVILGASVPWKAVVHAMENAASVKQYPVIFGQAGQSFPWTLPHRDYASRAFAANAGFDGFRVVMTNMDANEAADLYATFLYQA